MLTFENKNCRGQMEYLSNPLQVLVLRFLCLERGSVPNPAKCLGCPALYSCDALLQYIGKYFSFSSKLKSTLKTFNQIGRFLCIFYL